MNNNKYGKVLTIFLIIIIIGIVGVLGYIGYNALKEKGVKKSYTEAAEEFEKSVSGDRAARSSGSNSTLNAVNVTRNNKNTLEGYEIIGTIEIPKIELKCPILDGVNKRILEIAVGKIYSVDDLNKPGNTVIYGHNYRNTLFFSRNDELSNGDTIYILDQEGNKMEYKIFNIFETTASDTTFYTRTPDMTEGKAEVTLSTCTDDASTTEGRLIIQARENN